MAGSERHSVRGHEDNLLQEERPLCGACTQRLADGLPQTPLGRFFADFISKLRDRLKTDCGIFSRRTTESSQDGLRDLLKTDYGIVLRRAAGWYQDGLRDPLKMDCGILSKRTAGSSQYGLRDPLNTDCGIFSTRTAGSSQHRLGDHHNTDGPSQDASDKTLKTESIGSANAYV